MSTQSCTAFLERAQVDPDLGSQLRAVTDARELIALGSRSGYAFGIDDLAAASSAVAAPADAAPGPAPPQTAGAPAGETTIGHYEIDVREVPELQPLLDELPNLTIKPATVDLRRFERALREDDLAWTSMSPAAPGFHRRYDEIMAAQLNGGAGGEGHRRDFHLVNLDHHVDHPEYESYFDAKIRTIRHLERLFGCEIQFSGSMWYPAASYRLWHTNETQPGWRMYLIDLDEPVEDGDARTFFRYMNPQTQELVTLPDRPKLLRFFRVDQRPDRLFWHCIVNGARRNRWSFGFAIPPDWLTRLQRSTSLDGAGLKREGE
jgi:hypothetical protein